MCVVMCVLSPFTELMSKSQISALRHWTQRLGSSFRMSPRKRSIGRPRASPAEWEGGGVLTEASARGCLGCEEGREEGEEDEQQEERERALVARADMEDETDAHLHASAVSHCE